MTDNTSHCDSEGNINPQKKMIFFTLRISKFNLVIFTYKNFTVEFKTLNVKSIKLNWSKCDYPNIGCKQSFDPFSISMTNVARTLSPHAKGSDSPESKIHQCWWGVLCRACDLSSHPQTLLRVLSLTLISKTHCTPTN